MKSDTCPGRLYLARGVLLASLLISALPMPARAHHAGGAAVVDLAVARTILALPVYVAESRGLFRKAGIDARTHACVSGQRCLADVFDGRAQLATTAELPVAMETFERDDFAIVASMVSSDRDIKVLTRRDARLDRLEQLVGRRVAIVKGTAAHYHLDVVLTLKGIDPRQVEMVPMQPDQIGAAMAAGRVDACAIWEPFAQEILRTPGNRMTELATERSHVYGFDLVADRAYIRDHEDQLVRLLQALDQAITYIHRSPAEARSLLAERLGIPVAEIEARWPDYDFRLKLPQSLVSTLEGQIRWARREGHVRADAATRPIPNVLDHLEPEPLRRAVPGASVLVK